MNLQLPDRQRRAALRAGRAGPDRPARFRPGRRLVDPKLSQRPPGTRPRPVLAAERRSPARRDRRTLRPASPRPAPAAALARAERDSRPTRRPPMLRARRTSADAGRSPVGRSPRRAASGTAACGSSATMSVRRGGGSSKTKQKSLSAGFASAGIETLPQPRFRVASSGMRWSFSSNLRAGHLDVSSERPRRSRTGPGSTRRPCRLPRASRSETSSSAPSPSAGGGRRSRGPRGCPAPLADRPARWNRTPCGNSRNASRRACQRPLSAFQSFCRRSEQIQISVRPARCSRM